MSDPIELNRLHQQSGHGKCQYNRETHITQIQQRRVEYQTNVLQHRVKIAPFKWQGGVQFKRIRSKQGEPGEYRE